MTREQTLDRQSATFHVDKLRVDAVLLKKTAFSRQPQARRLPGQTGIRDRDLLGTETTAHATSDTVTFSGRVVSGRGQAAAFTQLAWVRERFVRDIGIDPYPGTLNLIVDDDAFHRATLPYAIDYNPLQPCIELGFNPLSVGPALAQLAPTQQEAPFVVTQALVFALFVGLGWAALRAFRTGKASG